MVDGDTENRLLSSQRTEAFVINIYSSNRRRSAWVGPVSPGSPLAQRNIMCVSLSADGDASADSRRSRIRCRRAHPCLHRRQSIDGHRLSSHTERRACLSSGIVHERSEYDDLEALLQNVLVSTRELPETTQVDRSARSYS